MEHTLERFFFSSDVNWGNKEQDLHPQMISRLLAGLVHPFIYLGHGLEFGQLGMAAEGWSLEVRVGINTNSRTQGSHRQLCILYLLLS